MKEYTKQQMELWGNVNLIIGAAAITAVHFVTILLGATPLNWFYQGSLLVILISVGYLSYRMYQKTKVKEE